MRQMAAVLRDSEGSFFKNLNTGLDNRNVFWGRLINEQRTQPAGHAPRSPQLGESQSLRLILRGVCQHLEPTEGSGGQEVFGCLLRLGSIPYRSEPVGSLDVRKAGDEAVIQAESWPVRQVGG